MKYSLKSKFKTLKQKRFLKQAIYLLASALLTFLLWWLYGCATSTDYRTIGDKYYSSHFNMLPENPKMHHIITVTVEVHIVGSRVQFKYAPYKNPQMGAVGYYWSDGTRNEIWILGKELNSKAVPCKTVLGHEFWNALVHAAPEKILSPYRLKDFGG